MGESVSEGIVSRWLKAVGDSVDEGEPLVEVTTDKVDVEVPAPTSGRLSQIVAAEGETVAVGATLAVIAPGPPAAPVVAPSTTEAVVAAPSAADATVVEAPAAEAPASAPEPPVAEAVPLPADPRVESAPLAPPPLDDIPPPTATPEPAAPLPIATPNGSNVDAAPLARRAAARNGIDLHAVHGSGPGGIVTKADVLGAKTGEAPRHDATVRVGDGEHAEPIKGPAAALVDYMERSRDIPTATSFRTIGVDVLDSRRRQLNSALAAGGITGKVSFTHLIGY